jgi:hypothetical protein
MIKGYSGRFVTGQLTNVQLCCVIGENIQFLFGYVLSHVSPQYSNGDWFATSYITDVESIGGRYLFTTANSIYEIDGFETIAIPLAAIDNIRMGTPPKKSLMLLGNKD